MIQPNPDSNGPWLDCNLTKPKCAELGYCEGHSIQKANPDSLSQELDKLFSVSEEVSRNYGDGKILLNRTEFNRIKALLSQEIRKELNRIWKTAVDNNVAGVVKWELEDRIAYWKER